MPKIAAEAPLVDLRECARKADMLYEQLRGQLERDHTGLKDADCVALADGSIRRELIF